MDVNGKVVWLTGASAGIGEALAHLLVERGALVILTARRADRLASLSGALPTGRSAIVAADLTDEAARGLAVRQAWDAFGHIDAVIHCAGVSQRSTVLDTELSVDRFLMELNHFAVVDLTRQLLSRWSPDERHQVVIVSSLAAYAATRGRAAYAASKAAVLLWSDALRAELAEWDTTVTVICPGYVRTELSSAALVGDGRRHAEVATPESRGLTAEDAAKRVLTAMIHDRREVWFGGKELVGGWLRRFAPGVLAKVVKRW